MKSDLLHSSLNPSAVDAQSMFYSIFSLLYIETPVGIKRWKKFNHHKRKFLWCVSNYCREKSYKGAHFEFRRDTLKDFSFFLNYMMKLMFESAKI